MDFLPDAERDLIAIFHTMEYSPYMHAPESNFRPLTRDMFAILVAVSAGDQIGAEIQSQVIGDGVGLYIRASSVYAVLHRFEEMGWVVESRKYYKLTDIGWKRLEQEARTLSSLVDQAKRRVIASGRGRW